MPNHIACCKLQLTVTTTSKQLKMNISKYLLLFISISIINQDVIVEGDYLVSIRIHDYTNPTNQCATCPAENNHCCDIQRISGVCEECNTFFHYCIRSFDGNKECRQSHQYVQPGRISLDFAQEFLLLQPNPLVFRGADAWEGAYINLTVYDRDINEPQNGLLNEVHVNITVDKIQLGVETAITTYTGPMGYSNITLSFYVTCAENWYGPYCNIFCQDCTCDLSVPCHDNCVGVVCGKNRHCVDGTDIYVCTCDSGFTGRQCEININECQSVNCSGNGKCIDGVDSFHCECDSGYSGMLCEITNEDLTRSNIADSFLDANALYILVPGVIGWALVIILGLVIAVTLACIGLRNRANAKHSDGSANLLELNSVSQQHQRNQSTASTPPIIMNRNQAFSPGESTSTISNQPAYKNISYRAVASEQRVVGSITGSGYYENDENELTTNQAYDRSGDTLYEHIV